MTWNSLIEAGKTLRESGDAIAIAIIPLALIGLGIAIAWECIKGLRDRRLKRLQTELLKLDPGATCPRCGKEEIVRTIVKATANSIEITSKGVGFNATVDESRLSCLKCELKVDEPKLSIKGAILPQESIGYRKGPS